jgi:outer membrane protein assembly factor BamB
LAAIATGLIVAVGCGRPAGPKGWAAPQPVETGELTLAPFHKNLFALPKGSGETAWQFPPKDRETYRVSEGARNELARLADDLGFDIGSESSLAQRIDELNVDGSTANTLKEAIDASGADGSARGDLKQRVDEIIREHRRALGQVRALYGDLAVSDDGETVYVPTYGGWLFALAADTGALRWMADLDPMVGGVTATETVLYVGTKSKKIYAIDPSSGAVGNSRKLDGEVWASPTLAADGDDIFVPTLGGSLYRLNDELETVWQFQGSDGAIASKPTVSGGLVYAGAFDNKLYAIDEATGDERWSIEADNWFWSQPVVGRGTLFAASLDGKVYAVDAESGEARWARPFDTGSQVRSGLAVSSDSLIVASRDGVVRKLDLDDGAPGGQLQIGTKLEADLVGAGDDIVYAIPSRGVLYAIDTSSSTLAAEFFDLPD